MTSKGDDSRVLLDADFKAEGGGVGSVTGPNLVWSIVVRLGSLYSPGF